RWFHTIDKDALFFFSSRRRHTRFSRDWSSDVCSSDLSPAASRVAGSKPRRSACAGDTALTRATSAKTSDMAAGLAGSRVKVTQRSEERRVGKEGRYRWGAAA